MQRKLILTITGVMLAGMLLFLSACAKGGQGDALKPALSQNGESKIQIETSFFAIGEFARAVGGNRVEVHEIVPAGTEPHDFEPKAMDIARIGEAEILAYNGLGMESWVEKAATSANSSKLILVDTSKGAELIENKDAAALGEHGQYDPHLWLSLKEAQIQAGNIKNALVNLDPEHKSYYEGNYTRFCDRLETLLTEYKLKFKTVKNRNFVAGHAAFAYLCRDFNLTQNSVENIFAEGEPSAKRLKELVDYCRKNNIATVFMEEMASPRISETLAREVNATVVPIHTAEAEEDGLDYIGLMEYNLKKVYESLR